MTHRSSQLRIWLPVAPLLTARSLTGSAVGRVNQAAQLALESQPFQAASSDAPRRLPIVGESTGVGTGATDPIRRLAGLLSQSSPCLHTNNQARAQPSWVLGATR